MVVLEQPDHYERPEAERVGQEQRHDQIQGRHLQEVERGGKGQNYAADRVKGKFCGLVWITKTVNANGRLVTWDSGYE